MIDLTGQPLTAFIDQMFPASFLARVANEIHLREPLKPEILSSGFIKLGREYFPITSIVNEGGVIRTIVSSGGASLTPVLSASRRMLPMKVLEGGLARVLTKIGTLTPVGRLVWIVDLMWLAEELAEYFIDNVFDQLREYLQGILQPRTLIQEDGFYVVFEYQGDDFYHYGLYSRDGIFIAEFNTYRPIERLCDLSAYVRHNTFLPIVYADAPEMLVVNQVEQFAERWLW